ncbi:MAG: DinB family protein [Candidatus Promineofilum sp.]|nr:DinB family protein [Promineifilum sp.]
MDDLAAILTSQYLASLTMLKEAIIACPDALWNAPEDRNKFWHVVYHTLFFTHLYAADSAESFVPWRQHRDGYEEFDGPPDDAPYDKATLLEYLAFCRRHLPERLPQLDLWAREGHEDRTLLTLERQINSIRHLMQHVGELLERLGSRTGAEIEWVASEHA